MGNHGDHVRDRVEPEAPAAAERRVAPRLRTLKEGRIVTSASTTVDCTIRDLSASGAKLAFAAPTAIPEEFRLLMKATNMLVPARLVWQRGLLAGITFTGAQQPWHSR
jgi:hypothetical protein